MKVSCWDRQGGYSFLVRLLMHTFRDMRKLQHLAQNKATDVDVGSQR